MSSGIVDRDHRSAQYLVPFTERCKVCNQVLACDAREHDVVCVGGGDDVPYVTVLKATCRTCEIRYRYDSFTTQGGKRYRLTAPREYLCVTNQLVISRRTLNQVWQRMVLQHATWDSEAMIIGLNGKQLREALVIDGLMRFHRETVGAHVMEYDAQSVSLANNHVRRDGIPSWLHSCRQSGPEHISHIATRFQRKWNMVEQERVLGQYQQVIVGDVHEKVCRRVCQFQMGRREVDPKTSLNVSVQCSGTPRRTTCSVHSTRL